MAGRRGFFRQTGLPYPDEPAFLRQGGAAAREFLAAKLAAAGVGHLSLARSASVL